MPKLSPSELERILTRSPLTGEEGTRARNLAALLYVTGASLEHVLLMNRGDVAITTREGKEGFVVQVLDREVFIPYADGGSYTFLGDILFAVVQGQEGKPDAAIFPGRSRPLKIATNEPNQLSHRMNRVSAWKLLQKVSRILTPRTLQTSCPFTPAQSAQTELV